MTRNPWAWVTEERLTYVLKLLLVIVLALYLGGLAMDFLAHIGGLVYIFAGAIFVAYLIYPLVQRLRRRMPLGLALGLVYLGLIAVLALAGSLLIPRIVSDAGSIVRNYPQAVASINAMVNDPTNPLLSRLPSSVRDDLVALPNVAVEWLRVHGLQAANHALGIVLGAFAAVATFVIIPLLAAYILLDIDRWRAGMLRVLPHDRWSGAQRVMGDVDRVIGGFIRGQLIVAACVGVLLTVALLVLHVPYAFLLGVIAAIGDLVPYVGAVLTFIPAVLIALVDNGWQSAALVAAVFVGMYQLEGHLIAPMVVGSQVKLSPLMVMSAVLIGAELGGLFGMLVAVPIAGVLRVILLRLTNQEAP